MNNQQGGYVTMVDYATPLPGAYATDLVGRKAEREAMEAVVRESGKTPRVVYLRGGGGFGKTRLLVAGLDDAGKSGARAAHAIVDLYHVDTHTASGLADAMYAVLTPPMDTLHNYERERQVLERMRLSSVLSNVAEQRQKALEAFA